MDFVPEKRTKEKNLFITCCFRPTVPDNIVSIFHVFLFALQYDIGDHLHTSGVAASAVDFAVRLYGYRGHGGQLGRHLDCTGQQKNANCDQLLSW